VGCSLILCFDCGISDHEAVDMANAKSLDVIICDHHRVEESLPNALAIINPKQDGCNYPYKELSACALAFKFAQAYASKNNIDFEEKVKPLLDLVAPQFGL
jgi:single-stranded-DNA-specific exonuclease